MAEAEVAPRKREGRPHIIPPAPGWRMDGRDRAEGWTVLEEVDGALGLTLWRAFALAAPASTGHAAARPFATRQQTALGAHFVGGYDCLAAITASTPHRRTPCSDFLSARPAPFRSGGGSARGVPKELRSTQE